MKNFGIDSKMYKYRKLISLSCGLKVEEIDSLIDGIEESLVEALDMAWALEAMIEEMQETWRRNKRSGSNNAWNESGLETD